MTKERYNELMNNVDLVLTEEELQQGWRFCSGWDFLLVNLNEVHCQECGKHKNNKLCYLIK